ncbi:MAG: DUF2892 domain-containing protein [Patescibacteria group bacterium]
MKKSLLALAFLFLFFPVIALAHQPRINQALQTSVPDPEISKAYYGELTGAPHTYQIVSTVPFALYANVLVPDIAGQTKDLQAIIIKDNDINNPIAVLDGQNFAWKKFFEPFGYDSYWMGPEYKADVEAGTYAIIVSSQNNTSKYSLAIGEKEAFDFKETANALNLIPELKRNFFNESPANFIFSPFGWGLVLIMFVLAFIVGFVLRFILKRLTKKSPKNIHLKGRILRTIIGLGLFALAITTTWSPILLFFAGFMLFEASFGWCVIYAVLKK